MPSDVAFPIPPEPDYADDNISAPVTAELPHSREAEEAVIGGLLINPSVYVDAVLQLPDGGDEFYIHRLRFIWESVQRLKIRRAPVDILTVSEELDNMGHLGEIGGQAYLVALLNRCPTTFHVEAYARIVHAAKLRRDLIAAANSIAVIAYDSAEGIEQVLAESSRVVSAVANRANKSRMMTGRDALKEMDADITRRGKGEILGISTGLPDLDTALGGSVEGGDLVCVVGYAGDGKSALLTGIATHKVLHNGHPAVFSMEMGPKRVSERMICQASSILLPGSALNSQSVHSGRLNNAEWTVYYHCLDTLTALEKEWHIDYTPNMTPEYIDAQCEVLQAQGLLDCIIVDQLGLMNSGMKFSTTKEHYDWNHYALKGIAEKYNVPTFSAHQMNKTPATQARRPILQDMNQGGQGAPDVVFFIWKDPDDAQNQNVRHLLVEKNRNGPVCSIPTLWQGYCTSFLPLVSNKIDLRNEPYKKDYTDNDPND